MTLSKAPQPRSGRDDILLRLTPKPIATRSSLFSAPSLNSGTKTTEQSLQWSKCAGARWAWPHFPLVFHTEVLSATPKQLLLFLLFQSRHIFFSHCLYRWFPYLGTHYILGKLLFGSESPLNKSSMYGIETQQNSRLLFSMNLKVLYQDGATPSALKFEMVCGMEN